MSTAQAPSPTIRNAGTKPVTPRKLFVNLVVSDLQRTIDFFEALGFTFNTQFTDATATSMLIGEDAYVMFLTREKFASFTTRRVGDPAGDVVASYALSAGSREEVDELVNKAVAAGGTIPTPAMDHGFMYGWGFEDLDGHHWEVFWMDPSVVVG